MKWLFLAFIFLATTGNAQKVALIDRHFKTPLLLADTLSIDAMIMGWFPIYYPDVDSIIEITSYFIKHIDRNNVEPPSVKEQAVGYSKIFYTSTGKNHRYRSTISLCTTHNNISTYIKLTENDSNKRCVQKLNDFTDYLKNNMAVTKGL